MRPLLLDTNAYSAFKQGDADIVDLIRHADTIAISPVVLGELLGGFDHGNKAQANRKELHQFLDSSRVRVYPLTSDTANYYSQVYCSLRKMGRPIPTNDIWIAAQSLEHGCIMCTYDKHFSEITGLLIATKVTDLT